jgi:hypothetical protein
VIASNPDNKWSAQNGVDELLLAAAELTPEPNAAPVSMPVTMSTPQPVILLCYCDKKGFGFRWEVHTNTGEAF